MSLLNYSQSLVVGDPENVNALNTMLEEARTAINSITNEQIAVGAGIDIDKIAIPDGSLATAKLALANGQIPVGNGANQAQGRTMGGAGALSAAGALSLGYQYPGRVAGPVAVGAGDTPIGGITISSGVWLVLAKATLYGPVAADRYLSLDGSSGRHDQVDTMASDAQVANRDLGLSVFTVTAESLLLMANIPGGGSAWDINVFGLRLA